MTAALPRLYFRTRETGALVFRIDDENRNARLDLVPLAVVNLRNGQVKPQGGRVLTESEQADIAAWIEARQATLAARALDDIRRAIDHLNAVAQWAQASASDDALEAVTDPLLLAMHDLRGVLVKRKADRLLAGQPDLPDDGDD